MSKDTFLFDLQLFGTESTVHELSDIAIQELSLVFANYDGREWAPRNPKAKVLATKAGETPPVPEGENTQKAVPSPTFLDLFAKSILKQKGNYVKEGVPDTIDNDGDGDEDYEKIMSLITRMGNDLCSACWMQDVEMRSAAIVAGIDSFLQQLDRLRSGEDDDASGKGAAKAGARHSKADKERLDKMKEHLDNAQESMKDAKKANVAKLQDHLDKSSDHIDKAKEVHTQLTASKYDKPDAQDTTKEENKENEEGEKAAIKAASDLILSWKANAAVNEDGLPDNFAELETACNKANDDSKKKKEPYGDVSYADDGLREDKVKRYPLDTEDHVRTAASYFGMEKSRSKYSSEDQKKIDANINAGKEKFGIGDNENEKAGEVNKEEVQAMITEALKASTAETIAAMKSAIADVVKPPENTTPVVVPAPVQASASAPTAAEIAAAQLAIEAKAKSDAKIAEAQAAIQKAEADAAEAQRKAAEAQATLAEMTNKARTPTATSNHNPPQNGQLTKLQMGVKAQLAANNQPIRF